MTAIEGLYAFLKASTSVTSLVKASNLFPAEGAQATGELRIIYEREGEIDDYALGGAGHQPTLKGKILCYGGKWGDGAITGKGGYATARQVADAVKNADGGFSGETLEFWADKVRNKWGGTSGVIVSAFWFDEDRDQRSDPVDTSGRGEQWVELDFTMCFFKQ